ncbi:MAG: MmcQ/YjbR family DNA-binding protein [Nocardioides sp.]|uniref:MmcQ/YjbR family DNA-binding protein n=1 Tax=Nocardioides sp. TaxID=35761 RepID=UPI003D6AB808
MATLEDLAQILAELPEVTEGERYGNPTWSVRRKSIAWLRPFSKADLKRFGDQTPPAPPILAINTADLHEKEGVLAAGIDGVFTIEHFNNYPAILLELTVIDRQSLRDLLVDAWLAAAPPDLADGFDG